MDQMSMKVQNQDISENTVDLNSNGTIPFKIVKRRRASKKKKDANNSEAVPTTCPEEERWNQMNKESEITAEVKRSWEVGKKLGLIGEVSNEEMRKQIEILERRDREKGDFNSVRKEGERIGKNGTGDRRDISLFDDFITQSCLIELPLVDRSYTWYRADESCKSKLDRMLVNDSWLEKWTDLVLKGLGRSISDHCPILLESSKKDWGSKPFKFFNCWITNAEFSRFIK
ncbi:hypothetical protein ACS0TY_026930 [Phlomoides rotata]